MLPLYDGGIRFSSVVHARNHLLNVRERIPSLCTCACSCVCNDIDHLEVVTLIGNDHAKVHLSKGGLLVIKSKHQANTSVRQQSKEPQLLYTPKGIKQRISHMLAWCTQKSHICIMYWRCFISAQEVSLAFMRLTRS
jgi:hypothetical protein